MQITNISAEELKKMLDTDAGKIELIDVREPNEYDIIHIKGAKLIPMNQIQSRLDEIDWDKDVVFYCLSGNRSRMIGMVIDKPIKNLQYGIVDVYRKWGVDDKYLQTNKEMISFYI